MFKVLDKHKVKNSSSGTVYTMYTVINTNDDSIFYVGENNIHKYIKKDDLKWKTKN